MDHAAWRRAAGRQLRTGARLTERAFVREKTFDLTVALAVSLQMDEALVADRPNADTHFRLRLRIDFCGRLKRLA